MTTHIKTVDDLRRAIASVRLHNIVVTDEDLIEFDIWCTATQVMMGGAPAVASLLKHGCYPIDNITWVEDFLASMYEGAEQAANPALYNDITSTTIEQLIHVWVTGEPSAALTQKLHLMQSAVFTPQTSGIILAP